MGEIFRGRRRLQRASSRARLRWNYPPCTPISTSRTPFLRSGRDGRGLALVAQRQRSSPVVPLRLFTGRVGRHHHTRRNHLAVRPTATGMIVRTELFEDEISSNAGLQSHDPRAHGVRLGRYLAFDKAVRHLDDLAKDGITGPEIVAIGGPLSGAARLTVFRTAVDMMDAGAQSPRETWLRLLLIDGI